jgi:hypothetical protein
MVWILVVINLSAAADVEWKRISVVAYATEELCERQRASAASRPEREVSTCRSLRTDDR